MIIGKINDKTEIDDCVLREATVSEEQVLFNKLNWENQQMILRIMRCLQPCEIIEEDKKINKIRIDYNSVNIDKAFEKGTTTFFREKDIEIFQCLSAKINELIDEVNELKEGKE